WSAGQGQACDGLKEAVLGACMVAGAAQIPHLLPSDLVGVLPTKETTPPDRDAAPVATVAAKGAEMAGETARSAARRSRQVAWEAFGFVVSVIDAAGRPDLFQTLEADFVAAGGGRISRPWWKFW